MRPLKVYLDTSVISFLLADDAPEKKITVELFEKFIRTGVYAAFISNLVVAEIENTSDEKKRSALLGFLGEYPLEDIETLSPQKKSSVLLQHISKRALSLQRSSSMHCM